MILKLIGNERAEYQENKIKLERQQEMPSV